MNSKKTKKRVKNPISRCVLDEEIKTRVERQMYVCFLKHDIVQVVNSIFMINHWHSDVTKTNQIEIVDSRILSRDEVQRHGVY